MPELPDVEIYKQYIDSTSLHKTLDQIDVKDDSVMNESAQTFEEQLKSRSFEETRRRGKRLFISTNSEKWLMLHFGMTGSLQYWEDENNIPDHTRMIFRFEKGGKLAYICPRKLGTVDLTDSPDNFCEEHHIGIDALEADADDFRELLNNKRGMIKTALMDQKTIAGLGNVYSDEVLYQCNIHPKTKTNKLDDEQISSLYQTMQRILKTSINNQADPQKMPDHYLINHRQEGADCPDCAGSIKRLKVAGRGCYICPVCQKS